ncbi:hypothetical protein WH47_06057, partial [Habropoda laboriosa]
ESLKRAQLATGEVQMASALVHRLFTRGHVKYVRFHGDQTVQSGVASLPRGRVSQSTVSPVNGVFFPPANPVVRTSGEGLLARGFGELKKTTLTLLT